MRNERLTDRLGEVTNERRNIAVSEAKRGKLTLAQRGEGIAKGNIEQQGKGIAKISLAGQSNEWLCEGKARHRSAKICVAKQRHCKDPLGVTRHSEEIAAGAKMEFSILVMSDDLVPAVKEWLSYGKLRGLGQWRNSGKGRFLCKILEERAAELADILD